MLKPAHNQMCLLARLMGKGLLTTYRTDSSAVARIMDTKGVSVKGEG